MITVGSARNASPTIAMWWAGTAGLSASFEPGAVRSTTTSDVPEIVARVSFTGELRRMATSSCGFRCNVNCASTRVRRQSPLPEPARLPGREAGRSWYQRQRRGLPGAPTVTRRWVSGASAYPRYQPSALAAPTRSAGPRWVPVRVRRSVAVAIPSQGSSGPYGASLPAAIATPASSIEAAGYSQGCSEGGTSRRYSVPRAAINAGWVTTITFNDRSSG